MMQTDDDERIAAVATDGRELLFAVRIPTVPMQVTGNWCEVSQKFVMGIVHQASMPFVKLGRGADGAPAMKVEEGI